MRRPLCVYIIFLPPKLDSGLIFVRSKLIFPQANCGDPDMTPLTVASTLGLHYYVQKLDSGLILVRYILQFLQANYGDPDQTPLTVVFALGLHYLPTSKNWILVLYWLGTS